MASKNANLLYSKGLFQGDSLNYTYFMNEFALILAFAKRRKYTNSFFGRGHGRDVIDSRESSGRLPFQWLKYKYANRVYAVSEATKRYIQNRYPKFQGKIEVSYLGIEEPPYQTPEFESEVYTILSVGRVRNIKRYYLIAEALLHVDAQIKWVHIGGVSETDPTTSRFYRALKNLMTATNIEVDLKGEMTNEEVFDFYRNTPVDLLLSVSEDEGLPVSMMEAISFGVPILATDVGGNSEIVNEKTGKLIPKDFSYEEFTSILSELLSKYSRDLAVRKEIRMFWERNFENETNFKRFLEKTLGL
ncbi:glycosyltransferase [Halocola ammonii]